MNQSGGGGWGHGSPVGVRLLREAHDSAVHSNAISAFASQFWERKLIKLQVVEGKAGACVRV